MKIHVYLAVSIQLAVSGSVFGQDRQAYIQRYKDIAIVEMHRTGIPASIKLAQAILESSAGRSQLALKSNNHFGIKCGGSWKGSTVYYKDDDRNRQGKLVKSCFRAFGSAEASFVAHSDFLMDPAKDHRYGFLFEMESDDYEAWAHGLKKAGYATNPHYSKLLIRLIRQYKLYEFDEAALEMIAQNREPVVQEDPDAVHLARISPKSSATRVYLRTYINGVEAVRAYHGDNAMTMAGRVDVSARRIVKFNDGLVSEYQHLGAGDLVFLEPKKGKFKGSQQYHMVKEGETMESISNKYGIKLSSLYKRNKLIRGLQPASGQRLVLRGKRKSPAKVRSGAVIAQGGQPAKGKWLDEIKPKRTTAMAWQRKDQEKAPIAEIAVYIVQAKDTLYQIALEHGMTVDALKSINDIHGSTIHPGQVLKLDKE